jgi:hypothetical protein
LTAALKVSRRLFGRESAAALEWSRTCRVLLTLLLVKPWVGLISRRGSRMMVGTGGIRVVTLRGLRRIVHHGGMVMAGSLRRLAVVTGG